MRGKQLTTVKGAMPEKTAKFRARFDVPEPDGLVITCAHKVLAVWAKLHVNDLTCVPLEKMQLLSSRHIPHANSVISAATGKSFAVGVKANAVNVVRVPAK